ncbi:MAG: FHA domain-containing protein, partial [Phycisphaeraceae bacterium]|nr:FHA domain-containing protein [Phycisphaeraceae bacterium]
RLSYDALIEATQRYPKRQFVAQFTHPLLVGSTLYTGQFMETGGGKDVTMAFVFVDPDSTWSRKNTPDSAGLRRAIYPLLRRAHGPKNVSPNVFTVGRTSETDLVLNDFSISRHHAEFRIQKERYFLKDCKATNGCARNGDRITPGREIEVFSGDMLSFGRFSFHFTPAEEVYQQLRKV